MNHIVRHASSPVLYSIGHGDRSIEDLISILLAHGIRALADVRAYPASRRHPQFSREELRHALGEKGIKYLWLGASLGGFRTPHQDARHRAMSSPVLCGFVVFLVSCVFCAGVDALLTAARREPTAMMCAERLPQHCHRGLVADYSLTQAVPVVHLIDAVTATPHRLHDAVRVCEGRLCYDGAGPQLTLDW